MPNRVFLSSEYSSATAGCMDSTLEHHELLNYSRYPVKSETLLHILPKTSEPHAQTSVTRPSGLFVSLNRSNPMNSALIWSLQSQRGTRGKASEQTIA